MMKTRLNGTDCPKDGAVRLRRVVLALAVLLLTCVLMAGAVSAADLIPVDNWDDLKNNLTAGKSVILTQDIGSTDSPIELDKTTRRISIESAENVVLDLAGHSIYAEGNDLKNNSVLIMLGNDSAEGAASLTVTGNGNIEILNEPDTGYWGSVFGVLNASRLTIDSGTFVAGNGFVAATQGSAEKGRTLYDDGSIVINGGSLSSTSDFVVYLPGKNSSLKITGGDLTGHSGVEIRSGSLTMTGGSISATGKKPASEPSAGSVTGASDSIGAAISLTWNAAYAEPTTVSISGGKVSSKDYVAILNRVANGAGGGYSIEITDNAIIDGATAAIKEVDDASPVFQDINGGTFIVHTYDDLKKYLEAGVNVVMGESITTTDHADTTDRIVIDSKASTLDLNGKTLDVTATGSEQTLIKIMGTESNRGSLTLKDSKSGGTIDMNGDKPYIFFTSKYSLLTIESGTYNSKGCIISGSGSYNDENPVHDHPAAVIQGGVLNSDTTAIYMTGPDGTLTINGGSVTGVNSAIEMRAGTTTITGGTIKATGPGGAIESTTTGTYPVSDGSAIVLLSNAAYQGQLMLNIQGNAVIESTSGAAIRNYVREDDSRTGTSTVAVTISGNPKLSGSVAAIENAHYAGDTSTIVGTFNLNGGYYKGTEVLKGKPSVSYPAGYSMTTNADENGYHFVTTATEPSISEEVTTNSDGTTTVAATSGTITYDADSQTVTMEDTDAGVVLKVAYSEITEQTDASVTGTVNAITAIYDTINLGDTHAVSLEIQLGTDGPASVIEQLPSVIKSVKEDLVTTALSAKYNNVQIHTLFEALSSNIDGFNGAISDMTITFHISPSAVGTNPNFLVAHFDANGALIDVHNPVVSKDTDGTWHVTITAEKFSGYAPFTGTAKSSGYTSSSSGNMDNAYRVLFNDGATTLSVVTDLSSGDKLTKPETPVKDGYTFAGWYKDSACTQAWDFETGIPGDMTLYAKWTAAGSSGETDATTVPTTTATSTTVTTPQPTKTQSTTATTSAPEATTAAGVSPTLT
ncbi:MAG TPA: InlB B-repeat-containing protein, partial [Methanocorpusculum sp.]|nr:InlB B-repeat-containing protein [Methanocorpusculum sp.]